MMEIEFLRFQNTVHNHLEKKGVNAQKLVKNKEGKQIFTISSDSILLHPFSLLFPN